MTAHRDNHRRNHRRAPRNPLVPIVSASFNWNAPSAPPARSEEQGVKGIMRSPTRILALAAFLIYVSAAARAGGPAFVAGAGYNPGVAGQPLIWANGSVQYFTDQGNLSPILSGAQADAFVATAFSTWTTVPGVSLSASQAGHLAEDVNGSNIENDSAVADVAKKPVTPKSPTKTAQPETALVPAPGHRPVEDRAETKSPSTVWSPADKHSCRRLAEDAPKCSSNAQPRAVEGPLLPHQQVGETSPAKSCQAPSTAFFLASP